MMDATAAAPGLQRRSKTVSTTHHAAPTSHLITCRCRQFVRKEDKQVLAAATLCIFFPDSGWQWNWPLAPPAM